MGLYPGATELNGDKLVHHPLQDLDKLFIYALKSIQLIHKYINSNLHSCDTYLCCLFPSAAVKTLNNPKESVNFKSYGIFSLKNYIEPKLI